MHSRKLKTLLLGLAFFAGALLAVCQAFFGVSSGPDGETWHTVIADGGLCLAVVPRNVEFREIPREDGRPPIREWSGWLEESSYSMTIIPVELRPKHQQLNLIENSAADLAAKFDGHVIYSVPVFADGFEGRHQIIYTGSIIFDQYMFVVGEKAITATVCYRTGSRPSRLIEHFLTSFRLNSKEIQATVLEHIVFRFNPETQ